MARSMGTGWQGVEKKFRTQFTQVARRGRLPRATRVQSCACGQICRHKSSRVERYLKDNLLTFFVDIFKRYKQAKVPNWGIPQQKLLFVFDTGSGGFVFAEFLVAKVVMSGTLLQPQPLQLATAKNTPGNRRLQHKYTNWTPPYLEFCTEPTQKSPRRPLTYLWVCCLCIFQERGNLNSSAIVVVICFSPDARAVVGFPTSKRKGTVRKYATATILVG